MKRFFTLSLVVILLVLNGCSLVHIDEEKAADADKGQPIIEYNDIIINKNDVTKKMNYYVTQQNMTILDLSEGSDQQIWERFKNDIVFELAMFQIALQHAKELGLDTLSALEKQTITETYTVGKEAGRQAIKQGVDAIVNADDTLDYDTEFQRQLDEYFFLHGYDIDSYQASLEQEYIVSKVKDYYTQDITATDEEVKTKYENDLKVQKSNMEKQPDSIEQQLLFGTEVLFYPEGYMYAKHILINFDSSDRGAAAIAYVDGNIGEYNRIISNAVPKIQARVDEVIQKLNDGEDFDKLMAQYSDDETLNVEPYKQNGFLIGPYSSFDLTEYLDAISELTQTDQYTDPVPTYMGCYIIKCEKMLAGPVAYEEIKDQYKQTLVEQRKAYEWSTLGQSWINDAKADGTLKMYTDRI